MLIIQTDQLRWHCLGEAGNPDVRTPNLDLLTTDAVHYTNAFCTYPMCTPSRYSLLSGPYARQHAGWSNQSTLAPGIETFPRALRRAGYGTAAVGKCISHRPISMSGTTGWNSPNRTVRGGGTTIIIASCGRAGEAGGDRMVGDRRQPVACLVHQTAPPV